MWLQITDIQVFASNKFLINELHCTIVYWERWRGLLTTSIELKEKIHSTLNKFQKNVEKKTYFIFCIVVTVLMWFVLYWHSTLITEINSNFT